MVKAKYKVIAIFIGLGALHFSCRPTGEMASTVRAEEPEPSDPSVAEIEDARSVLQLIGGNTPEVREAASAGQEPFCAQKCHWHGTRLRGVTPSKIQEWAQVTQEFKRCLVGSESDISTRMNCLKEDPSDPQSFLTGDRIGFYRAGLRTVEVGVMKEIFMKANDDLIRGAYELDFPELASGGPVKPAFREARFKDFVEDFAMPSHEDDEQRGRAPNMTASNYKKSKEWMLSQMRGIKTAFKRVGETDIPSLCLTEIQDEDFFFGTKPEDGGPGKIGFYQETKTHNWQSKLLVKTNNPIEMFGCDQIDERGRKLSNRQKVGKGALKYCFNKKAVNSNGDEFPEVDRLGHAHWAERKLSNGLRLKQKMRLLRKFDGCRSTFWVRSSADGRFFAGGLRDSVGQCGPDGSSGFIFDLQNPKRKIGVNSPYDPGFFPDNEGFTFIAGRAVMCSQSVLTKDTKDLLLDLNDKSICGQSKMGVYQHIGRGLDSDEYLTVRSDNYANDDGGYSVKRDPRVERFNEKGNVLEVWPFRKSDMAAGHGPFKVDDEPVKIKADYDGDFGISPSGRFITARIGGVRNGESIQLGYRLATVDLKEKTYHPVARICLKGGKPTLNFTERFMAVHHYADESDREDLSDPNLSESQREAAFQQLVNQSGDPGTKGSANIYLFDIKNQRKVRLTKMGPGQYALYPHFRADGWLYFVVRDTNSKTDYAMATDAAIRLEDPIYDSIVEM